MTYKYQIQKYSGKRSRYTCPKCNNPNQFTLYIDTSTGIPIAPHIGICNRLSKCGYHNPPRNKKSHIQQRTSLNTTFSPIIPEPSYIHQSLDFDFESIRKSYFYQGLINFFDSNEVIHI